jgi:serine-type D-Ala-D-Ala carboxypeptidase (penicillin-binding protein 5/6)
MTHSFRKTLAALCLLAGLNGLASLTVQAQATQTTPTTPTTQAPQIPSLLAAPEVAAKSYLLLDVTANQILAAKNMDSPIEPASLTKLMTAYLVFDALKAKKIDLKQALPISTRAWKMPGSRMFIDPTMQVPVEDLIKGMIVQSGNDAVIALAEGVGGSVERFVQLMNEQAKVLGLKNTGYKNPEGLTEAGHTTTARDLSVLATRLMADFPQYTSYYAIKKYRYQGTPTANDSNRNLLLFRDPSVDGLKTGHTDAAGYCLIATAKREFTGLGAGIGPNATPGNRRLLAIVLGTASENDRANEAQKLLNWGYTAFEAVKLFDAGQAVITPKVWKGVENTIKLGRAEAIVVAVPAGSAARLKTSISRADPLMAPLQKGQQAAVLKVAVGDQAMLDIPLIALEGVAQAGFFGRAWDALRLWIK